jgi:hypothetical protein
MYTIPGERKEGGFTGVPLGYCSVPSPMNGLRVASASPPVCARTIMDTPARGLVMRISGLVEGTPAGNATTLSDDNVLNRLPAFVNTNGWDVRDAWT